MAFQTVIRKARFVTHGYTGQQMAQVAKGLIDHGIRPRIQSAVTVTDAPAPPLQVGYAKAKLRKGLKAIRDWTNSGFTLRAMQVVTAQQNRAVISFDGAKPNQVAAINNARIRQFGVSPHDRPILSAEFDKLGPHTRAEQVR